MSAPVQRDERGRLLPGFTSNPGGRPKIVGGLRDLLREDAPRAVERLRELMASKNETTALAALNMFFDRLLGKPVQAVEADVRKVQLDIKQLYLQATKEVNEHARAAESPKVIDGSVNDEW
jgi:hypothetical protein